MKYLFSLFLFFFLPFSAHAFNVVQATSTHALGFDIEDVDLTGSTMEIRVYPPNTSTYSRTLACAFLTAPYAVNAQSGINDIYLQVRPRQIYHSAITGFSSLTGGSMLQYGCLQRGIHTVALFDSNTDTSPNVSDTIYLEQNSLDLSSTIILLFLVGAMLSVLRPVISKLTLR